MGEQQLVTPEQISSRVRDYVMTWLDEEIFIWEEEQDFEFAEELNQLRNFLTYLRDEETSQDE